MKNIIFTGGGSGGHVMPALTLIEHLKKNNPKLNIHYIGGISSIERDLTKNYELTYYPIHTGKLRRYLSIENLKDLFKVILGFFDALRVLFKFKKKDSLVFATGGFVCVPVVMAAKVLGFKIFIHEQTSRVGLANKIASKFCDKVFVSFEESLKYFPKEKTTLSGYPLRSSCYEKIINEVKINNRILNHEALPILFVTGGGNGSGLINKLIKNNLDFLTSKFVVVHQTGKSEFEEYQKIENKNYLPLAFVGKEMIDLYKLAQITVSRSGAGTVCELMAIGKKSIFVPLRIAQKNEQFHNAMEAHRKIGSIVIEEKDLTNEVFLKAVSDLAENKERVESQQKNGLLLLAEEVQKVLK